MNRAVNEAPMPPGWARVRLEEVVINRSERVEPRDMPDASYVGLEHVESDTGRLNGIGSARDVRSTANAYYKGDVLYGRLRPYLNKVLFADNSGLCSAEFAVLVPVEISPRFLAWRLRCDDVVRYAMSFNVGVHRPRIRWSQLRDFEFLLPPRREQDRIVEAVESAMDAVHRAANSLVEAEARLLHFRAAVLHTQLPVNETSTVLGDVADVRSGLTKGRKIKGEAKDVPFLRAANVQEGRLDLDEIKTIPATATERERFELRDGDVLLVEGSGSPHRLGQGWIWRGEISGCLHQNHVFRARPNRDLVMSEYLAWAMQSPAARDHFRRMAKTTSGLSTINRTQIEATPVPLPPLDEQREVVARLERLRQTHATLTDELQQLQGEVSALRRSILHHAFSGQLVPQDPDDEPASELLNRIEAEKAEREAELKAARRRRRKGRSGSSAETAEALPRPPSQSGKVGTSSD